MSAISASPWEGQRSAQDGSFETVANQPMLVGDWALHCSGAETRPNGECEPDQCEEQPVPCGSEPPQQLQVRERVG